VPDLARAGTLINPDNPLRVPFLSAMKHTADTLKIELAEFAVREPADLEGAFAAMAGKPVGAFVMIEEPILIFNAETCANLAIKYRLPACGVVELAQAGGCIGYGIDVPDMWRRAATFVDKIFKRAKPADLPVEQPTKFLTVVNLKTAKTIGIDVPTALLVRADEVIE
jgi:putative ABC transport system substrate-binding protein